MTPLIPALINLLVSGVRGRGGGGGGGGGGGREPLSVGEKSDNYWRKQLMGGDILNSAMREMSESRSRDTGAVIPFNEQLNAAKGGR